MSVIYANAGDADRSVALKACGDAVYEKEKDLFSSIAEVLKEVLPVPDADP